MSLEWQNRGTEETPYKARNIAHEANTSLEYGEKTWTTAQTVRDLLQNHLDAETERFYGDIASTVFEDNKILNSKLDKKVIDTFLYAAYMFVSHVEDMAPEAKRASEEYLKRLGRSLPIKTSLLANGIFETDKFLQQAGQLSENIPLVSYDVIDKKTNESLGLIPYEALRDEPLYQEKTDDEFRYEINGMKIVDHGSGYDSQLSALYLSSKAGKEHVRGKFGEGAKMSELHLLRNKAKIKMRSEYILKSKDGDDVSRLWQTKSKVKGGRLVSEGIEIEKAKEDKTGSMVYLSFEDANKEFKKELIENIDPRIDGLGKNISKFNSQNFVYPMPITGQSLVGVDMSGDGKIQYVKGIRVELANESFGYSKPWFSYDVLDSSIIAGRDRNEIKDEIVNKIENFWENNDNPELLKKLVHTVVHDKTKPDDLPVELSFFRKALSGYEYESKDKVKKIRKVLNVIDEAMIHELKLEEGVDTLILSNFQFKHKNFRDIVEFAESKDYKIITTAATIYDSSIGSFSKRLPGDFKVFSADDIRDEIRLLRKKDEPQEEEFVEGERELKIREVFDAALNSVNTFLTAAKVPTKELILEFDVVKDDNRDYYQSTEDDYEGNDYYGYSSEEKRVNDPIWMYDNTLMVNPNKVSDPRYGNPGSLQHQLELYLLSAYSAYDLVKKNTDINLSDDIFESEAFDNFSVSESYYSEDDEIESKEETLKRSQAFLDSLITKLIPDSSAVLKVMPESFDYTKDTEFVGRLLDVLTSGSDELKRAKKEESYEMQQQALSVDLSLAEAKKMLSHSQENKEYDVPYIIKRRVFVEDNFLHYYNNNHKEWGKLNLVKSEPVANWNQLPVYQLDDGRFFVPATMAKGSVLTSGEGKKRAYTFNEGEKFLVINQYEVKFSDYSTSSYSGIISANADGFIISENDNRKEHISTKDYIQEQLQEYKYYPVGTIEENKNPDFKEGITSTAIPIEYGKDEWDNPVRVFQDIIQNHLDASLGEDGVKIIYEVDREGDRIWVEETEIIETDKITGFSVTDNGKGYAPNTIATMGASSKKSPLFAGKYGEGQKMVAAAALRSGLDLEYQSTLQSDKDLISWRALAVSETRQVVLEGQEVEKKLVAFNVTSSENKVNIGSSTTLKLPKEASIEQIKQWSEWVETIDPRQKDKQGNGGMARFVRQLREPGSQREYKLGSITLLLDEPGAVYENGLRINSNAEAGRKMSFGYDVPEIVTTRERNSYNPKRLGSYINHVLSHVTDEPLIEEIFDKLIAKNSHTLDLRIIYGDDTASAIWAKVARKLWPGYLVHSGEEFQTYFDKDLDDFPGYETPDEIRSREAKEKKAAFIRANIVHLDKSKILYVSKDNYSGFSQMLPTVEKAIDRLSTELLDTSPEVKEILSNVVAESTKIFNSVYEKEKDFLGSEEIPYDSILNSYDFANKIRKWSDNERIMNDKHGVGVAPITAGFHGSVDRNGVIFNEHLLVAGNNRELAETSLHEIAHLVSGAGDYSERFVTLLYKLAEYFVEKP